MEAADDPGSFESPGDCGAERLDPQQEISNQELYDICNSRLDDIEEMLAVILKWIAEHPDKIERNL